MEWLDYLIDRDHYLYTRSREAEWTCPFGMVSSGWSFRGFALSWISHFVMAFS